jgi:RNA polymerase sigma-70 factor (ECF subfamily)
MEGNQDTDAGGSFHTLSRGGGPSSSDDGDEIPESDQLLIERLRAGDPSAIREIVDAHGPALLRLATAVTGSPELGDDVVQQTLIRLWDRRESLKIQGSLRQYLWRSTRNQAISVQRHERLLNRVAGEAPYKTVVVNEGAEALDAAALQIQIMGALRELPPRCQEIFLLSWRDSMTAQEIAQALGISVATVRNQILRAVKHLGVHFGYR